MSSPFASLLGTNYCPRDDEIAQIKALLVEPCLRLKSLDEEIVVMRKALDKLTEERDALNTYVEAHKSLISPFRRLPRDIVQVIFLACLPTHRNCVMSAQEAPILLGRICSSWRAISLSAPRLWSRLHVVKPTLPYGPYYMNSATTVRAYQTMVAQRLKVAEAWLRRSGTCPLSISLQSSRHYDPRNAYDAPRTDPFLDILIPFASRWQDISVTIPSFAVQALLELTEHDVPLLESLTITVIDADSSIDPTPGSLLSAARLSRFSLTGGDFHHHQSSSLSLSWCNLTSLTLVPRDAPNCQIILDILARCSRLRACKVGVAEHEGEHLQDSIVECLSLHSMEVWCYSSPLDSSGRLLSRLSVPNLQDFTLGGREEPSASTSLISSLATCTCLQSISIANGMFRNHELVDFLRGLPPSARRLRIAEQWHRSSLCPILGDNFFASLELSPERSAILPALKELAITNNRELSDDALLRFIISRMSTLRRVDITFEREMQVDILPSLQSFMESSGAQIFLAYRTDLGYDVSPYSGLPDSPRLRPR
ncbi:hypothetical protein MSAN_00653600 [Mycena sanguinolenta]|uniref:F-box domain-containing protein n=1 Tax=Mycena sanguinolenta TaxID=230812 RepID=A0A8H7DFE9_9AGAR|nr:hypothetical protein MSAN_00653600 [Mycena sanguinolenta]